MKSASILGSIFLALLLAVSAAPLIGFALIGCGSSQDKAVANPDDSEEELSPKGKKWGGWRWKGKRNDCFFKVENECFKTLELACKKARCGDSCGHDDSAPAKVSCEK